MPESGPKLEFLVSLTHAGLWRRSSRRRHVGWSQAAPHSLPHPWNAGSVGLLHSLKLPRGYSLETGMGCHGYLGWRHNWIQLRPPCVGNWTQLRPLYKCKDSSGWAQTSTCLMPAHDKPQHVSSLAYHTFHLPVSSGLSPSSVFLCPLCIAASFRFHPWSSSGCKLTQA